MAQEVRATIRWVAEVEEAKRGMERLRQEVQEGKIGLKQYASEARSFQQQIKTGAKIVDEAGTGVNSFSKTLKSLAGQFTIATVAGNLISSGIHLITSELKDSIRAGIEEEQQWNKLKSAYQTTGNSISSNLPKFQAMTDQLEMMTGVADTLISAGFTSMTRALIPLTAQYDLMKIALDASVNSGKSLDTVIDLFIKASAGNKTALEKLGTEFGITRDKASSFNDIIKEIGTRSLGAATAAMDGQVGSLKEMQIEYDRTKEAVGGFFVTLIGSWSKQIRQAGIADDLEEAFRTGTILDRYKKFGTDYGAVNDKIQIDINALAYIQAASFDPDQYEPMISKLQDVQQGYLTLAKDARDATQKTEDFKKRLVDLQGLSKIPIVFKSKIAGVTPTAVPQPVAITNTPAKISEEQIQIAEDYAKKAELIDNSLYQIRISSLKKYAQERIQLIDSFAAKEAALQTEYDALSVEDQLQRKQEFMNAQIEIQRQGDDAMKNLIEEQQAAEARIWLSNHEYIGASVNAFFSGMTNAIMNHGKVFKEALRSMASSTISSLSAMIAQYVIWKIAMAFTKNALNGEKESAHALGDEYNRLAIAKAAASAMWPLNLVAIGTTKAAMKAAQVFDDPVNDAILRRENRRIARISSEGIAQGFNEAYNRNVLSQSDRSVKIGDVNVIIQGNADANTVEIIRKTLRTDLTQMIKDGEVSIPTTDRRRGR